MSAPYAGDLTPHEAWDLLASDPRAVLVDVRTEGEWQTIGVPDTADLAVGDAAGRTAFVEWTDAFGRPNPAFLDGLAAAGIVPGDPRPVVFLCRSGVRSVAAATTATAAGLGPAYNVLTGFEGDVGPDGRRGHTGWRAAGLPWRDA
ncbi:rhodanese-like domain-containing protein [Cellulomonas hominis]|uniref:rhodanese-like domain-containing protein n=1 Tax=Cellulomonas hominis TaxID=156981 RepID=UPI0014442258|nr:rhodanese-like domain-containing protein [Cellulomonas hominis]NKY09003.1 rhodanese-like domain-containing protein [Cellulomonas hominis]